LVSEFRGTTLDLEVGFMVEVFVLPVGIPGVGRKGDYIVSEPDHPNPNCRLARFGVLEPTLLSSIKTCIIHPSQKEEKSAVSV